MRDWQDLARQLALAPAVLVRVERVQGSGPREVGAWMALSGERQIGTIGGGRLEFDAIQLAREALARGGVTQPLHRFALRPSLGPCCGGVVWLAVERVDAAAIPGLRERLDAAPRWRELALFGGGHVGRAIVALCARLPLRVHWIDSREEIFPPDLPETLRTEHSDPVQAAVPGVAPGARVLIMSFSHAEDLDILAACLKRQRERGDLASIGLIGSKSKWAAFRHRLEARGFAPEELDRVRCPIGLPGITGKQPEVIALAVVAQLMQDLP